MSSSINLPAPHLAPTAAAQASGPEGVRQVFERLRVMLRGVARGELPLRECAVTYLELRSFLLASPQGGLLPGFLYQCGTVDRFRSFIVLYDPDIDLRAEFVDRMIARAQSLLPAPGEAPEPAPVTAAVRTWDFD